MSDKKISALTAAGALTGAELVPIVQSGQTVRTTTADVFNTPFTAQIASQAEAEAGTNNTKAMTPLRVRQAEDFPAGAVSVLTYGAIAGTAGAYVTNQTAIHAALATGRPVFFPDGQTFYTQAITIPTNAHSIFGRATIIAAGTIAVAALFAGTSSANIVIRDLTIQINTTTYTTLDAINLTSATDPLIENVTANGYNGILTTSCTRPRVRFNRITDFNNIGIVDRGSTDVEIIENRVTTTNTTTSFYCIQASASDGADISHNWVSNAFKFGIVVSGLDSGAFTPVKMVTVSSNRTLNTGLEGISIANVTNFAVTGNVCRWTNGSSRDFGISCFGDPNTSPVGTSQIGTISGNVVFQSGKVGIALANNCQDITVSGNTIYGANTLNGATVYHISGILFYGKGSLNNKAVGNNIIDPLVHLTWATNEFDDGIGAGTGPDFNSFSNNSGVGTSGGSNWVGASSSVGDNLFYLKGAGSTTGVGPIVVFRPALTVLDANFALQDDVDPTKQVRFQLSSQTTGQVRTITTFDASDTLVGLATAQALTNKTYNGNTWTAGTGILTIAAGKTWTVNNTLTATGTDGSSIAFGTGGTVLYTARIPIVFGSQTGVGGAGATQFFLIGGSATELNIYGVSPYTGTFRNLYLNLNTAPGGVQTDTFTLRVNGADTAITVTVTGAAVSGNDTTHTAAITAGQTFSIKIVGSASAAATIVNGGIGLETT